MAARSVMMPPAEATLFLSAAGWPDARISPLAGDASFRRYFRVEVPGRRAVLMDAPPPHEDCRPFVSMAEWLREQGFHAPAVLARDLDRGLLLLEDFGDARLSEVVAADPGRESPVYAEAIDLLRRLHVMPPAAVPAYDMAVLLREAALFTEWYLPSVELEPAPGLAEAWQAALAPVAGTGTVTVLRDYHAENIMLLEEGQLGLLDFQDALAGHPAYDLVSLLQDARRDVSETLEAQMLQRYGQVDPAAYALLGAQRNAKILGIFARLWRRDGKPRYLSLQPRVWRYLERDLAHPALSEVRGWFDAHVPSAKRAAAWAAA
jgi:hypothetical protein